MSPQDCLYTLVHARFHEAFGQPHNLQGGGEHWNLQPTSKFKSAIHVLLNGTPDKPGVWVFDPHSRHNGVQNTAITEQRQIGELIQLIQNRLEFANNRRANSALPPDQL